MPRNPEEVTRAQAVYDVSGCIVSTNGSRLEIVFDGVEVLWGDGVKTKRKVISTSDLTAFGKKRSEIPFDARGKKWVRFAAWDVAMNGALVQPVGL
ncbi:MAG: hypothetical protein ACOC0R_01380 [Mariniphaga sp.]